MKAPFELIEWWATSGYHNIPPLILSDLLKKDLCMLPLRIILFLITIVTIPAYMYVKFAQANFCFNEDVRAYLVGGLVIMAVLIVLIRKYVRLSPDKAFIVNAFRKDVRDLYKIGRIKKHLLKNLASVDPALGKKRSTHIGKVSRCSAYLMLSMHELAKALSDPKKSVAEKQVMKNEMMRGLILMKKFQLISPNAELKFFYQVEGPAHLW
jgi:hypothetical protein